MNGICRKIRSRYVRVRTVGVRALLAAGLVWQGVLPLRAQSPTDQLLPDQTVPPLPDRTDSLHRLLRQGKADTNRVNVLLQLGTYFLRQARETGGT
ncbi:MAG TPA: hypothetical protein VF646_05555, partial [Cytophagales bacterium]